MSSTAQQEGGEQADHANVLRCVVRALKIGADQLVNGQSPLSALTVELKQHIDGAGAGRARPTAAATAAHAQLVEHCLVLEVQHRRINWHVGCMVLEIAPTLDMPHRRTGRL